MRIIGKRSVSSFLRVCLGAAWYAGLAVMAFYLCGFIVLSLRAPKAVIDLMRSSGSFVFACDLSPWGIRAQWPASALIDRAPVAWLTVAALIDCAFFQAIVFQLRRIVANLSAGMLFREEDSRRVRAIGALVILAAVAKGGASFVSGLMIVHSISVQGASLDVSFELDIAEVFVGLVVVVLGEVFRCGAAMRAEADLTV